MYDTARTARGTLRLPASSVDRVIRRRSAPNHMRRTALRSVCPCVAHTVRGKRVRAATQANQNTKLNNCQALWARE